MFCPPVVNCNDFPVCLFQTGLNSSYLVCGECLALAAPERWKSVTDQIILFTPEIKDNCDTQV
jgi:hypothetical protein